VSGDDIRDSDSICGKHNRSRVGCSECAEERRQAQEQQEENEN